MCQMHEINQSTVILNAWGYFFLLMLADIDLDRLLCGQILNIDGINAHKFWQQVHYTCTLHANKDRDKLDDEIPG